MRRIGAHLAEVAEKSGDEGPDDARRAAEAEPIAAGDLPAAGDLQAGAALTDDAGLPAGPGPDPSGDAPELAGVPALPVRGVVMLEDVIEALIGEIRDATRRSPDRTPHSR